MIEKAPKFEDFRIYVDYKNFDSYSSLLVPQLNKIEREYWYWDKIKYIKTPENIKDKSNYSLEVWELVKTKRSINSTTYRLGKAEFISNISYQVYANPYLWKSLHYLDFNFGAGIQKKELLDELDKQKYLTNALMEESIYSSKIEGASTTRVKAKEMLRKNKTPKNKSEQMILNNYETIQYISEHKEEEISIEKLYEIHRLVTKKTLEEDQVGVFRENDEILVMNDLTGEIVHTPPPFKELETLMKSFCEFFNNNPKENFIHPIVKASILHFLIGYIHPFADGNGRTARALFYWYLLKNGYWLTEYLSISRVIMKSKTQYENAYLYTEIDDMDVTYFIHYQVKVLTQAFEDLKEYMGEKKKEEKNLAEFYKEPNINERQAQILFWIKENSNRNFTVKEIETVFSVTNQTARTDLESLVEKNILKKIKVNQKTANYWKGNFFDEKFGKL
jgi:Fic family protein